MSETLKYEIRKCGEPSKIEIVFDAEPSKDVICALRQYSMLRDGENRWIGWFVPETRLARAIEDAAAGRWAKSWENYDVVPDEYGGGTIVFPEDPPESIKSYLEGMYDLHRISGNAWGRHDASKDELGYAMDGVFHGIYCGKTNEELAKRLAEIKKFLRREWSAGAR